MNGFLAALLQVLYVAKRPPEFDRLLRCYEVCMVYVAAAVEARWYGNRAGGGGVAALLTSLWIPWRVVSCRLWSCGV